MSADDVVVDEQPEAAVAAMRPVRAVTLASAKSFLTMIVALLPNELGRCHIHINFTGEKCPQCQRKAEDLGDTPKEPAIYYDGRRAVGWNSFHRCPACRVTWRRGRILPTT